MGVLNAQLKDTTIEKSLCNLEFVKKIKSQEGQTGVKINIEDLWK